MAKNDSILMIKEQETKPFILTQLSNYKIKNNKLYYSNQPICDIQYYRSYAIDLGTIYSQTLLDTMINTILSGETYSTLPFEGTQTGGLPGSFEYYRQQYNTYFKLKYDRHIHSKYLDTVVDANKLDDMYMACNADIVDGEWFYTVIPWQHWGISNLYDDVVKQFHIVDIAVGTGNKQAEYVAGVGLVYDEKGTPFLVFTNKNITNNIVYTFLVSNEYLTISAKARIDDDSVSVNSLYFELVDSDTYDYGEESTPAGYSGGYRDNTSDYIGIPDDPNFDITQQGGGYFYKIQSLKNVILELFPDFTVPSGLDALAEYVHNIFELQQSSTLKSYVIDAYALPVTPKTSAAQPIQVGWKTLEQQAPRVTKQFVTYSCGKYSLKEYFANFLDYEGTTIKLFLPFIGFVDLSTELAINSIVEVVYKFDVVSGEFTCFILSDSNRGQLNSVISQYSGNAITHIPINTVDYAPMINGAISGASKLISSNFSVSGAMNMASGVMDIANSKPEASLSNPYTGSSALMGIRTPFYLISRPVSQFSAKYRSELGLPLNVAKKLSDVKGFTICQVPDYNNSNATLEECEQIKNLLNSGIIL